MSTYLVTRNIIRRIFEDIATAHKQIFSFGYGEEFDFVQKTENEDTQTLEQQTIYPRLFVAPDTSTINGKEINRVYRVIVADLIKSSDYNSTEVESDTEQIILDVIAKIQDQRYGFVLDIENIEIIPFKDKFADKTTGHMATVTLTADYEFNRCQIPEDFLAVTNPYVPYENGSNERDPLSWHKTGNTLVTSSVLGSNNNQDWRIIHNNATIATVTANGIEVDGNPLRPVKALRFEGVNTEIQDDELIGASLDGMFIWHAGTEQITIENVQSFDSLTGTITFVSDLGGTGAVKILMIL